MRKNFAILFLFVSLCTFAAKPPLFGRVKVVTAHADYKVRVVTSFQDLNVKKVTSTPTNAGEWQFVDDFADFTIQFVDAFEDFTICYVTSFPGLPSNGSKLAFTPSFQFPLYAYLRKNQT